MTREKINEIVCALVRENCAREGREIDVDAYTPLIGSKRVLDSMGLVNLIADIETALLDEGVEITLTSEAAMSEKLSPFRSVGSLCALVEAQVRAEEKQAKP